MLHLSTSYCLVVRVQTYCFRQLKVDGTRIYFFQDKNSVKHSDKFQAEYIKNITGELALLEVAKQIAKEISFYVSMFASYLDLKPTVFLAWA